MNESTPEAVVLNPEGINRLEFGQHFRVLPPLLALSLYAEARERVQAYRLHLIGVGPGSFSVMRYKNFLEHYTLLPHLEDYGNLRFAVSDGSFIFPSGPVQPKLIADEEDLSITPGSCPVGFEVSFEPVGERTYRFLEPRMHAGLFTYTAHPDEDANGIDWFHRQKAGYTAGLWTNQQAGIGQLALFPPDLETISEVEFSFEKMTLRQRRARETPRLILLRGGFDS